MPYEVIQAQSLVSSPLKYEVITAPAVEPVTVQELITSLRLPTTVDSALVSSLGIAARCYVEQKTRQTLINTTYDLWLDDFPYRIILPARPAQSVTFIHYVDQSLGTQTLSTSNYLSDLKGPRPSIIPPLGYIWPIPKVQYPNAVQVRFVAGFGATAASVPEIFKNLIKQWVALNYVDGANILLGNSPAKIPDTFNYLLSMASLPEV